MLQLLQPLCKGSESLVVKLLKTEWRRVSTSHSHLHMRFHRSVRAYSYLVASSKIQFGQAFAFCDPKKPWEVDGLYWGEQSVHALVELRQ